jgi:hypothetical protein
MCAEEENMNRLTAAALAAITLAGASRANAHHSNTMFDSSRREVLVGTVREFQWTNPHCYVQLLVEEPQGQLREWSLEMGAPTYLYASGWRKGSLKAGDQIRVNVMPLRSGAAGALVIEAFRLDGTPIGKEPR